MPNEKCASCGKTVYVVEALKCLDRTWHKWCFKCTTCKMTLNMKNYAATGGKPYCKTHYPMPTAIGSSETAPPVEALDPNRGIYQTTEEASGQSQGGYEAPASYDQQQTYEQPADDQQQYYQQ